MTEPLRQLCILAAALCAGIGSAFASSAAQPVGYEATYRVEYKGMYAGDAVFTLSFDRERSRYVFESRTRARGLARMLRGRPAVERSEFYVNEDGRIVPLMYSFDDGSRKGKRSTNVLFDWGKGVAISRYKGVESELELQEGMLDRMTMQTAVMRDMARPAGPSEYLLVDRNTVKRYRYEAGDTTTLDTVLGSLLTRIYQQSREGSSRQLKIWVAPSLRHMAVRMEQQRDGKTQTVFTLKELRFTD